MAPRGLEPLCRKMKLSKSSAVPLYHLDLFKLSNSSQLAHKVHNEPGLLSKTKAKTQQKNAKFPLSRTKLGIAKHGPTAAHTPHQLTYLASRCTASSSGVHTFSGRPVILWTRLAQPGYALQ
uniref:Uncharacterized protein n=1 Tax=Rhipicephalus zambeziensis TaxID=60191 RepID=A0A224YJ09_9ACAR